MAGRDRLRPPRRRDRAHRPAGPLGVLEFPDRRARGPRHARAAAARGVPHARADLERLGLARYLSASVFSSEIGIRKPDPRIFREALGRVGAPPGEAVFVGDRLYDDISGAQAVGMRAVQTRQFRQEEDPRIHPDAVIDHIRELPDALAGLRG
ncbi:MAG: HAD family hydrolase [Actinobacteria bacterium]|nr:MAG: HAD family hydrolase [Actinomycetota bacterium]